MAEIFVLTRGHIEHVERWERSMRNIYLPIKAKKKLKDENGNVVEVEQEIPIDVQLRPYQLWGIALPDEKFLEPMCNSLGIPTQESYLDKEPGKQEGSFISGFGVQGHLTALRLALGAKKLPKTDLTKGFLTTPIYKQHVNILGIGWRPDEKIKTSLGEHEAI
jgi:hypothetical protein